MQKCQQQRQQLLSKWQDSLSTGLGEDIAAAGGGNALVAEGFQNLCRSSIDDNQAALQSHGSDPTPSDE